MLLFNRYEYNPQTDLIGKGGFSRVYKALDKKFNRWLALKIYKSGDLSDRYSPIAEISRVINLDHPNICRYLDIEEIEKENSFGEKEKIQVCVMELLDAGNFAEYYHAHKDHSILKKLLADVVNGLSYLHKNGIIHRDIKPANILIKDKVDGPIAKITDFGISKRSNSTDHSSSSVLIVSVPYMAPEQFNAKKYGIDQKVSYNIDFWSLGVAVFEIITGNVLFKNGKDDSREQIMNNIMSPEIPAKIRQLPQPFRDFVARCIIKDARERVQNAEDLLRILSSVPDDDSTADTATLPVKTRKPATPGQAPEPATPQPQSSASAASAPLDPEPVTPVSPIASVPAQPSTPDAPVAPVVSPVFPIPSFESDLSDDDTQLLVRIPIFTDAPAAPAEPAPATPEPQLLAPEPLPPVPEVTDDATQFLPQRPAAPKEPPASPAATDDATQLLPPKSAAAKASPASAPAPAQPPAPAKAPVPTVRIPPPVHASPPVDSLSLFNRYDYNPGTGLIGKGGFSRVYKAFDKKLNRWVALKIYKAGEFSDRYSPIAEIRRVVNLDHSNICRYLDIEEIEKENTFGEKEKTQICVMELLDGGNLAQYYAANKTDDVLKKLVNDVLNGLSYLHKNGIIHRDIKPANILIKGTMDGPVAKITDFGISKRSDSVNNNSSSALIVSIPYMAPEQLNVKKYGVSEKISFNLDLWSLGVTIYEVITGKVLFKNSEQDSSEQIMTNIMAPELPEKIKELPQPFRDIVAHCIIKDARERAQKAEELIVLLHRNYSEESTASTVALPPVSHSTRIENTGPTARPEFPRKTSFLMENSAAEEQEDKTKTTRRSASVPGQTAAPRTSHEKTITFLRIAVGLAAVLLVSILFFYIRDKKREDASSIPNKRPDSVTIVRAPVTTSPSATAPQQGASAQTQAAIPRDTAPESSNSSSRQSVAQTPPVTKEKRTRRTNEEAGSSGQKETTRSNSGKYILQLTASEACTVKCNNQDYGLLKPREILKIYLKPGKWVIQATSIENPSSIYQGTLEVTEANLGVVTDYNIVLPKM